MPFGSHLHSFLQHLPEYLSIAIPMWPKQIAEKQIFLSNWQRILHIWIDAHFASELYIEWRMSFDNLNPLVLESKVELFALAEMCLMLIHYTFLCLHYLVILVFWLVHIGVSFGCWGWIHNTGHAVRRMVLHMYLLWVCLWIHR